VGLRCRTSVDPSLWSRLHAEARARTRDNEPAHDFFHVERVMANAGAIARGEGLSAEAEAAAITAALLHELFTLPKNHPDSARAGDKCAEQARATLECEGAPSWLVEAVHAAIRDHSFSKGVMPDALETRVLQDADRLDAIGAIGLARMWATCADMKRPFYSPDDPFCESRVPDDKQWGLDHVYKKLLAIPDRLHTKTARAMAEPRVASMQRYLEQLRVELAMVSPR
jgi:uncharacterized protein